MPALAEFIPAHLVLAAVLRDVLRRCVQRPVRTGERRVEKEWFVTASVLVQELHRVIGEQIGQIEAVVRRAENLVFIDERALRCHAVEVAGPADETEVAVKPAIFRPVTFLLADVPLAALHELHDGDLPIAGERPHHHAEGGRALALAGPGVDEET